MSTPAPVSYRHGGLVCTDHTLDVPLDHHTPDGPTIGLFAREVVAAGREHENLPRLLWLQGGPGGRAERPNAAGAWLRRALADHRVVLLDQRGTGRSTPADAHDGVRADAAVLDRLIAMARGQGLSSGPGRGTRARHDPDERPDVRPSVPGRSTCGSAPPRHI